MEDKCIGCEGPNYNCLNGDTYEYSGIIISIHNSGAIRVRALTPEGRYSDVVKINYCPICGKKLRKED